MTGLSKCAALSKIIGRATISYSFLQPRFQVSGNEAVFSKMFDLIIISRSKLDIKNSNTETKEKKYNDKVVVQFLSLVI